MDGVEKTLMASLPEFKRIADITAKLPNQMNNVKK